MGGAASSSSHSTSIPSHPQSQSALSSDIDPSLEPSYVSHTQTRPETPHGHGHGHGHGIHHSPKLTHLTIRTDDQDTSTITASPKKIYEHDFTQDGWVMPATPSPKTWKVASSPHRTLICRFCGGRSCKREDYTKQTEPGAIKGLHSTWVSANVIGMQRPSSRLIQQFDIITQFKENHVGAIFNLQANGEHPHCGDGIHPSGFSYKSEEFTDHGISYYNFGWIDMHVPTMDKMLQIVQVMSYHTETLRQKIAIHCHAGYGRTGLAIACFFIYAYGIEAQAAIESVRHRRDGSIETSKQINFVHTFAASIHHLRTLFYDDLSHRYTLHEHLSRQRAILHGGERDTFKTIPKLVHTIITRLTSIQTVSGANHVASAFIDGFHTRDEITADISHDLSPATHVRQSHRHTRGGSISMLSAGITPTLSPSHTSHTGMGIALTADGHPKWSIQHEDYIVNMKKRLNVGDMTCLQTSDVRYLTQILLDWMDTLATPIIPCLGNDTPLLVPDARTAFNSIPALHLSTCHIIFTFLHNLHTSLDQHQHELAHHLFIRLGWTLMQPPCSLPEICAVRTIGVFQLQSRQTHPSILAARATFESGSARSISDLISDLTFTLTTSWHEWYDERIKLEMEQRESTRIGVRSPKIHDDVTKEYLTRTITPQPMKTPATIGFIMNGKDTHDMRKYEMVATPLPVPLGSSVDVNVAINADHYKSSPSSMRSDLDDTYLIRPVTAIDKPDDIIRMTLPGETMYHIKTSPKHDDDDHDIKRINDVATETSSSQPIVSLIHQQQMEAMISD